MSEKGAIDWTIGKLINIVLVIVVLALVLYGGVNQGFGPLIDNFKERWEESIYLLNSFRGEVVGEGCYNYSVSEIGGGQDFLSEMGIGEASLDICQDGICNISWGGVEYRKNKGVFEKRDGGEWREYRATFANPEINKLHWSVYDLGVGELKGVGVEDLYNEGFTRELVLTGDGAGMGDEQTVASWANGQWKVIVNGRDVEIFSDNQKAMDRFVEGVRDGWDDKVYWKVVPARSPDEVDLTGDDLGRSVEELLGSESGGDVGEIDSEVDVLQLKARVFRMVGDFKREAVLSDEVFVELESLKGKNVEVLGKSYVVGVENDSGFPVLTFDSGSQKFGLKYDRLGKIDSDLEFWVGDSFGYVGTNYFPVSLVGWSGSGWSAVGDESVYRLKKVNFDEAFEASVVKAFVGSKCR